jgi:hypothetical protein
MGSDTVSETRPDYVDVRAVEIEGEIAKVQTLSNGLVRVTIDLQEYCLPQGQILLGWIKEFIRATIERQ